MRKYGFWITLALGLTVLSVIRANANSYGDANGDGSVTATDALIVLQRATGQECEIGLYFEASRTLNELEVEVVYLGDDGAWTVDECDDEDAVRNIQGATRSYASLPDRQALLYYMATDDHVGFDADIFAYAGWVSAARPLTSNFTCRVTRATIAGEYGSQQDPTAWCAVERATCR